jgi:hypothetical protein
MPGFDAVNRTQSFNSRLQPAEITDWLTSGGFSSALLNLDVHMWPGGWLQ